MSVNAHDVPSILILLAVAVLAATFLGRLRVPPLLAYIASGLAIGPSGLGLVTDTEALKGLAELGVVFLLFAIGLDLPLNRLTAMRRFIFGLGTAQVVGTLLVIALCLSLVPLLDGTGFSTGTIIAISGGLALSSTATVVRVMVERHETVTRFGRATVAVLLLQDLAVVPLLSLIGVLASPQGEVDLWAGLFGLVKGVGAIAVILFGGRFLLRRLFRLVADSHQPELFTGLCLLVVLGLGLLVELAGMSMALGAFLAGLALADTPYRHQVDADVEPFRGLLLGLFFVSLGMALDLKPLFAAPGLVLGLTVALIVIKAAVAGGLGYVFGLPAASAVRVGTLLAQAGEFTFVVANLARGSGLMSAELASVVAIVAALSLAATPFVIALGGWIGGRVEDLTRDPSMSPHMPPETVSPVLIAGFGRVGRTVAEVMMANDLPYVALDVSTQAVAAARKAGYDAYYGDCRLPAVLRSVGIARASLVVIALDNVPASLATLQAVRQLVPDMPVIARAHDLTSARNLHGAGATEVVPEAIEASLQLAGSALRHHGRDAQQVEDCLAAFRTKAEESASARQ
ncbi:cation:proton antiporter [Zavarzinia sp.]|uniref:cation:proton antiporter domain-containing protein n=1 Tax=Zavarzinia sp. TaxID=2027920 RepID=UPI0035634713